MLYSPQHLGRLYLTLSSLTFAARLKEGNKSHPQPTSCTFVLVSCGGRASPSFTALGLLCFSASYVFLSAAEHLVDNGCAFPPPGELTCCFSLQVWCPCVLRETVMATLTWWPTPMWRTRLWSRMICQRGTSHGASTRAGASTGQAAAPSTRRRSLAWPVTALKGKTWRAQ